jgi:molecular chaperone DnaK
MFRQKIDYGIDLGTTNSAISRFDKGKVRILKSERLQKDTTPSCVHFTKRGQLLVGDAAYSRLAIDPDNTKTEFKRTMGTEASFFFPNLNRAFSSEELSSEILKALKASVKDEDFSSAVITVPADFDQVQIDATQKAGEMAGFAYCELLQEPIAASLAYIMDEETISGSWLVFDMGGGTFDAALMNADSGVIRVVDTAGDNHLGGKNMDLLIVDEIIIPKLKSEFKIDKILESKSRRTRLVSAWKRIAEQYKIQLSTEKQVLIEPDDPTFMQDDEGEDLDICIDIGREQFETLIKPLVDRAISISLDLVTRNGVKPGEMRTVLLIGGPTYMPYVRERIAKDINHNLNITMDPMTAVASGAALFASTKTIPESKRKKEYSKIQLGLDYPNATAESQATLKLSLDKSNPSGNVPSRIFAEIHRLDQAWASGRMEVKLGALTVKLNLVENEINGFTVNLFDEKGGSLPCAPDSFSVLQGIFISNPPLTHDICIEAETEEQGHTTIPLLTKNQVLPAIGKKAFKTTAPLRPGEKGDVFRIIVREGEHNTRPVRNIMVGNITITGASVSHLVKPKSDVEITLRMDESRRINVAAYFPGIDETIQNVLETSFRTALVDQNHIHKEIGEEMKRVEALQEKIGESGSALADELSAIETELMEINNLNEKRKEDVDSGYGLRYRLNEVQIRLDKLEVGGEWERIARELEETYEHAKKIIEIFGEKPQREKLKELTEATEAAVKKRDKQTATGLTRMLDRMRQDLLTQQPGFWISILNNITSRFEEINWMDPVKARRHIAEGKKVMQTVGFSEDLKTTVKELWKIMSKEDQEKSRQMRTDLPFYRK